MLYEYALTPDLFDSNFLDKTDPNGTILIEILRGLADSGLLANLNKDGWIRHVKERSESLSPALKDRVFKFLSTLNDRNRLVRYPKSVTGAPSSDRDWLELALVSHDRIPFHAIVLSRDLIDNSGFKSSDFVEYSGTLYSSQWSDSNRRTLTLTKSSNDYRINLAPVLRYAKRLALIDPYLNCQQSRYFETVAICSELLGDRGRDRLAGRVEIHALAEKQPRNHCIDDCLIEWKRKLQTLADRDRHKFTVFLWKNLSGSVTMHDRYILTDQCGLSIPGGLDCRMHSNANSTDWNLMDERVRVNRWTDYNSASSPFELLDSAELVPNS